MPFLDVETMLLELPGLLLGFTLHELAHGYVAYFLGDPSPKHLGRLTLNPLRHIDPVGFLLLLTARFGWAKPVEVNAMNFADPRRGMALVAAAGPVANFLVALLFLVSVQVVQVAEHSTLGRMLWAGAWINVSLGVFNLLPIPPLDGSKVLGGILPAFGDRLWAMENAGWIVLIVLLVTGIIGPLLFPLVEMVLAALVGIAVRFPALGGAPGGGGPFF